MKEMSFFFGEDAPLSKKGIELMTESYDIQGLGHRCIMRMAGFRGVMIKDRDAEIADYTSGKEHWYDDIRFSCRILRCRFIRISNGVLLSVNRKQHLPEGS